MSRDVAQAVQPAEPRFISAFPSIPNEAWHSVCLPAPYVPHRGALAVEVSHPLKCSRVARRWKLTQMPAPAFATIPAKERKAT